MQATCRTRSFAANVRGRDFFVGDLHGQLDPLLALLDRVGFGSDDRLFSVGDLVDRGPKSWELLQWFRRNPNCFAVLGNHDALMIATIVGYAISGAVRMWGSMGSQWFLELARADWDLALETVKNNPLAIEIEQLRGPPIGVVHAGVPLEANWGDFLARTGLDFEPTETMGQSFDSAPLWGREHCLAAVHAALCDELPEPDLATRYSIYRGLQPLSGVSLLIAGHTPLPGRVPLLGGNRLFIDTGGYLAGGWLTLVEPATQTVWQSPSNLAIGDIRQQPWPTSEDFRDYKVSPQQIVEIQREDELRRRRLSQALGYGWSDDTH